MSSSAIPEVLTQEACDSALRAVCAGVSVTPITTDSHDVVVVSGLETLDIQDSIATYLLNCAAQTVQLNLVIVNDLLGESPNAATALRDEVNRLLGPNNAIGDDFRQDHRDPWIAEALAHLLLRIAGTLHPLPPPGELHVLTTVHDDVKEHGLDLVGIYTRSTSEDLGLSISESKASENNATSHVASTAALFVEVMNGLRDPHIRSKVQVLRNALPEEAASLITSSFWKNECCLTAYVAMGTSSGFDVKATRPSFSQVVPRATVVVVPLSNYRSFFDGIADRIRLRVSDT